MGCPPDVSRVTWRKPGGRGSFCRRASTGQSQVPLAHAPKSTPHHHIPSTLAGPMVRLGAHAPLWHSRPAPYEAGFPRLTHCLSVRCWQVIPDPPRARTPPSFRRYAAPPPWSLCSAIAVVALHGRRWRCCHQTAAITRHRRRRRCRRDRDAQSRRRRAPRHSHRQPRWQRTTHQVREPSESTAGLSPGNRRVQPHIARTDAAACTRTYAVASAALDATSTASVSSAAQVNAYASD